MKRQNIGTFFCARLMLLLMLVSISCQNDESDLLLREPDLKVIGDAIHFRDLDSFSRTMQSLHERGMGKLNEFEKSIGFQNSLRQYMTDEAKDFASLNINIKDLFLATVVNERGVYYIGKSIHKIGAEFEYSLEDGNEIELNKAIAAVDGSEKSGEFRTFRITGYTKNLDIPNGHFSGQESQTQGIGTDESGNSKRIVIEAWSRNYVAYASNGVNLDSESYRRTCGWCSKKWRGSAVQFLRVEVESRQYSSITGYGNWFVLSKTEQAYSTDHIQQVMDYVAGTGVWIDTDYIKCDYIWIGGNTVRPVDYSQHNIYIEWRN